MAIDPISLAMAASQTGIGLLQGAIGNSRLKRLMKQQTAYQTPQEFFDINNMAMNEAQTGFSAETQQYLTSQTDRALSSTLGASARFGGDPNDLASIFDRNASAILKNSSDSELLKLQKFNRVYDSITTLGNEEKAEFADKQAMLKDKMAAAGMKVQAGAKNLESGLNMGISSLANSRAQDLYGKQIQEYLSGIKSLPTGSVTNATRVGGYTTPLMPTLLAPRP